MKHVTGVDRSRSSSVGLGMVSRAQYASSKQKESIFLPCNCINTELEMSDIIRWQHSLLQSIHIRGTARVIPAATTKGGLTAPFQLIGKTKFADGTAHVERRHAHVLYYMYRYF